MTDAKLSDIFDALTPLFLNLLYTLLLTIPTSCFLQRIAVYIILPLLEESKIIAKEYEKEFALLTKINHYLLRNPCTINPHSARCQ
jgi:hypothetical protein